MSFRRFTRYSLRTMLLVLFALSVWFGWISVRVQNQRKAVESIQQGGGQVVYDYERDPADARKSIPNPEPPGPAWLRDLVGEDWFSDVIVVRLFDVDDESLGQLAHLPKIRRMFLRGEEVTDIGLAHVASLDELEYLELDKLRVTDEGLVSLAGLDSLEYLCLRDVQMTDAGLSHFAELPALETLYLERTRATSEGVREFAHSKPAMSIQFHP